MQLLLTSIDKQRREYHSFSTKKITYTTKLGRYVGSLQSEETDDGADGGQCIAEMEDDGMQAINRQISESINTQTRYT